MARPKGSKNKSNLKAEALEIKQDNTLLVNLFGNNKDIKKEIRALKKLKLQCRPGTAERLDLEHKIKALKKQRAEITAVEPGKDKVIAEILKIEAEQNIKPRFEDIGIDLHKFTIEQLEYHLKRIKEKRV
jgi:uncharacterized protein with von Willebrand factor type A (vWA) domain